MSNASGGRASLLRVGDLSSQTGVSARLLRYYNNQGLLEAERSTAGQRLFAPTAVARVRHIRWLLDAGLPTRVVRELLDCIRDPAELEPCAVPTLVDHLDAYDQHIAQLVSTRTALQGLIDSSPSGM